MVARVARAIFEDIRFASNIYIFYVVFRLWIPAPFAVCKIHWKEKWRTMVLGVSKMHFVVAACVLMWGWDFIDTFSIQLPELRLCARRAFSQLRGLSLTKGCS